MRTRETWSRRRKIWGMTKRTQVKKNKDLQEMKDIMNWVERREKLFEQVNLKVKEAMKNLRGKYVNQNGENVT